MPPSLINVRYLQTLNWSSPEIKTLEEQHLKALFTTTPVEMGVTGNEEEILKRLQSQPVYQDLFGAAFPAEKTPFRFENIVMAIAAYVRSLESFESPYDQFAKGSKQALSLSAKKGMQLFFSDQLKCASCHTPPHFSRAGKTNRVDSTYFNTGLYNLSGSHQYPETDNGLRSKTQNPDDDGKFRVPSLRNLSFTSPYMHDGSVSTLEEVIDHYASGGRVITSGPLKGDGRKNKNKAVALAGFSITANEKLQLIEFLHALSDSSFLSNTHFTKPR